MAMAVSPNHNLKFLPYQVQSRIGDKTLRQVSSNYIRSNIMIVLCHYEFVILAKKLYRRFFLKLFGNTLEAEGFYAFGFKLKLIKVITLIKTKSFYIFITQHYINFIIY